MDKPEAVIVLTTWPADTDPSAAASTLVEERLAACVNVLAPMDSIYRWQGAVERSSERQMIVKTTQRVVERLLARLKSLHPYDVPEMLVVPVAGGGEDYLRWVSQCTSAVP